MARKGRYFDLAPGSPPSLPTELNYLYQSLDDSNRIIFIKVFRFLWGVVCPMSRFVQFGGVLHSYWIVDMLRERSGLIPSYLTLLTYIYHLSNKGQVIIHSDCIYHGPVLPRVIEASKHIYLCTLTRLGYLSRCHNKPATARLPRQHSRHPVFIQLTPKGVNLIEGMEKDLYNILMRTSLNELTGTTNKKA